MKKKLIVLCLLLSVYSNLFAQEEFKIGVFNEPYVKQIYDTGTASAADIKAYREMKEAFINLSLQFTTIELNETKYGTLINSILKLPSLNYKLELCITDVNFTKCTPFNNFKKPVIDSYLKNLKNYRQQGYTTIFNIGDEPNESEIGDFKLKSDYIKLKNLNFKTYVNLFGIEYKKCLKRDANGNCVTLNPNVIPEYKKYLQSCKKNLSSVDYVSFDQYSTWGLDEYYFCNYALMKQIFNKGFLSYIGVTEAGGLKKPSDSELRLSVFTALAYGTKGILYFNKLPDASFSASEYMIIKAINQYVAKLIGPVIMASKTCQTFHKNYNKINVSDPNLTISEVNSIVKNVNQDDILFGVFKANEDIELKKTENGLKKDNTYLLIVNKSLKKKNRISIKLRGNFSDHIYQFPSYKDFDINTFEKLSTPMLTSYLGDLTQFTIDTLEGGEGVLVKVQVQ